MLDIGLYVFYALVAVAILGTIVFSIINALKTPGAMMKSGIAIVSLVILFVIAYLISSDEVTNMYRARGITGSLSKLIEAGLIMFYITMALSFLALIYSEINKALK